MVETTGECKQGMDINYKSQWGYMVQAVTLANTGEPLYVVNRPGNRPSHEQADVYLDRAVALCRRAGFRQVRLRGDTDFSQTRLFYITNDFEKAAEDVVFEGNHCCNQENLFAQLKGRPAFLLSPGRLAREQLGLHGFGFTRLDPEGMDGALAP